MVEIDVVMFVAWEILMGNCAVCVVIDKIRSPSISQARDLNFQ